MNDPRDMPAAGRPTFTAAPGRGGLRASRAPKVPFAVLLGALLLGGMGLLLLLNTASAANELGRQQYADADSSVSAQVALLRNEVAASAAPGNLAAAAAALGMVPGGNPAFLVVGADGTVITRGSAAPASAVQVQVPKATPVKPKPKPTTSPRTPKPTTSPSPSRSVASSTSTSRSHSPVTKSPSRPPTSPHRTGGHR